MRTAFSEHMAVRTKENYSVEQIKEGELVYPKKMCKIIGLSRRNKRK